MSWLSLTPRWPVIALLSALFTLLPALAVPVIPNPAPAPVVPLLPEGEAHLDTWEHAVQLAPWVNAPVMVQLRLPGEARLVMEQAPLDDMGMVWHLVVDAPRCLGEIRFVQSPKGMDLDPFEFYLATTLFPAEAIALARGPRLLEVEAPVEFDEELWKGFFRAEQVGAVVAVTAIALPEPVSADDRATAWASLRAMFDSAPAGADPAGL